MGLAVEAQFDMCVDALYGSLRAPGLLPTALAHLSALCDAPGVSFIRADGQGRVRTFVGHGYDPTLMDEYVEHYVPSDPARLPMLESSAGEWFQDDSSFDRRHSKSPYVVEFTPKVGIRWFRGGKLHADATGTACLSIARPRDARNFDASTTQMLERLYPHLARLSRLMSQTEAAPHLGEVSQALADVLGTGLCVVDAQLRVEYANRCAIDLCAGTADFRITGGTLRASPGPVQGAIEAAVALATTYPYQARSFCPNPFSVMSQRLQVRVLPLAEASQLAQSTGGPYALVFIARGPATLKGAELCQLFGLTTAEATLVAMLARGLSPDICADRRGVAISTVRTQLKSIYDKTGVCSLPQLVSLVTSLPGLL